MSILSYNLKPATPYHPPPTTLPPPLHLAPDLGHSVLLERLMNHLRVALLFFTCNSTLHMYQRHALDRIPPEQRVSALTTKQQRHEPTHAFISSQLDSSSIISDVNC